MKAGAPKKAIDWNSFEKLCELQCTQSEIASFFKVHPNTLSDRAVDQYGEDYSTVYKKFSEVGKISLRRYQFTLAKKNTAMAIWLGKHWLGQKEETLNVSAETAKQFTDVMQWISEQQKKTA